MTASDSPDDDLTAPGLAQIEALVQAAFAALPAPVRQACADLALRVEDFPTDEIVEEMELESPWDLTGLYQGVPLTEKSTWDMPTGPDTVWLYRRPILDEWVERGDVGLAALVSHVLVHEIAHHLGWSDADIMRVDDWTR
ncbi:metallopeptidase family protein [Paroceanicella profunda]|uniref:Metallopeptidase family protein n=1 Tax=Paroceanicella profunda TaxID=2579971 RepID=A0A5B8G037_9RHOB|nr:metallopeptidase family protein [Paroceanicella profunda]QDL93070.1 metallopeptidase family protein [Paroceanicella profunda]